MDMPAHMNGSSVELGTNSSALQPGVFAVADKPDMQLTDWRTTFASALRERDTGLTGKRNIGQIRPKYLSSDQPPGPMRDVERRHRNRASVAACTASPT
jgi:hypothetical protein